MLKSSLFSLESQTNWRSLVSPAVAISIGLHALLLFLPLSGRKQPESIAETVVETRIIQLPKVSSSPSLKVSSSPLPKVAASLPVSAPVPPPVAPPVLSATPRSFPIAVSPQPQPAQPQPAQPQLVSPTQPAQPPPVSPTQPPVSVTPSPSVSPTVSPTVPPVADIRLPFGDFPHLTGSQAGCYGEANCHQLSGNFRATTQTLIRQMQRQGYQVKQRSDLEDQGQQIIELRAKDGTTRFLSVLSHALDSTIYLLASDYITLADLQQGESIRSSLEQQLEQVSQVRATVTEFPYPTAFFQGSTPIAGIQGQPRLVGNQSATQLLPRIANQLKASGFSIVPIGNYGGGTLYEVGKKAFTGYLSFVPTQRGTGTIVVLWQRLPELGGEG